MNRNLFLAVVLIAFVVLLLTGVATSYLEFFQAWLNASHSVSGLVLVIGAIVIAIGTKVLWK